MENKRVGPISFAYVDFISEAKRQVEDAESKAKCIKDHAFKEGYNDGYNQGIIKGIEVGKQQYQQTLANIISVLKEVVDFRNESYKRSEVNLVKLAMTIAKAIVHAELKIDQKFILSIVRKALEYTLNKKSFVVKLNPLDKKNIEELKGDALSMVKGQVEVDFQTDEGINAGGCLVETDIGYIDARLDKQIKEIEEYLMAKVEEEISIWKQNIS
ncbi:MAG: FliH/SctL family protein [bacterium]